jgi:uncharacterized protein YkwD
MNRSIIFSIALCLFLLLSAADLIHAQRVTSSGLETDELRVLSLINRERGHSGLSSLVWNASLADLARNYSQTMARDGVFDHIDRNGDSVVERARHSRIRDWTKIGENLFECDSTNNFVSLAIRGWMHSPSHRDNILDPEWSDTGIGIAYARNGEIYITEIFSVN